MLLKFGNHGKLWRLFQPHTSSPMFAESICHGGIARFVTRANAVRKGSAKAGALLEREVRSDGLAAEFGSLLEKEDRFWHRLQITRAIRNFALDLSVA